MSQEFEKRDAGEVLPQNFGDLPAEEGQMLVERASRRLEITQPKGDFREGLIQNLQGLSGWIETNKAKLTKSTIRAITGATFVAVSLSACSPAITHPRPEINPTQATSAEVVQSSRPAIETVSSQNFPISDTEQVPDGQQEEDDKEKDKYPSFYDVVNPDAKPGETGYDYGVVELSDEKGFGIVHQVAGYYATKTYDPNEHVYKICYYPIEVPSNNK